MTILELVKTTFRLAETFIFPLLKSVLGAKFSQYEERAYELIDPIVSDMLARADALGLDLMLALDGSEMSDEIQRFIAPYLLRIERTLRNAGLTEVTK